MKTWYEKRMAGCKEGAQKWKMTWARHGMALRWKDDTKIGGMREKEHGEEMT